MGCSKNIFFGEFSKFWYWRQFKSLIWGILSRIGDEGSTIRYILQPTWFHVFFLFSIQTFCCLVYLFFLLLRICFFNHVAFISSFWSNHLLFLFFSLFLSFIHFLKFHFFFLCFYSDFLKFILNFFLVFQYLCLFICFWFFIHIFSISCH